MNMLDFYTKTISFGDLIADQQGMLSHQIPGTDRNSALTITSKRVVLPTKEHLSNPDWSNRMAFHPLVENQIGSESLIHERFRRAVNQAMNLRFSYILVSIARICKEEFVDKRNKLSAQYAPIWAATAKADDTFYKNVVKLIDEHPTFVHTVIHRGLRVGDSQWRVGCEVFFPVLEELITTKNREICGVKMRVCDVDTLKNLYELLFPGSSVPNSYTRGSDNTFSPSLFAQLNVINLLYTQLNQFFNSYDEVTEDKDFVRDTFWISQTLESTKELNDEAQAIGLLEGNSSKPKKNAKTNGSAIEVSNAVAAATKQNAMPQQAVQHAPIGTPVQHHAPAGTPIVKAPPPLGSPTAQPVTQQTFVQPIQTLQAPVQQQTPQQNMTHQKIGMDPSQINSGIRTSSATGFVKPRNIPTEHVASPQQNMVVMQTPQGPVAVQSMSMAEAAQLAQQQAQQQQQQQQRMQMAQQKAVIAQQMGFKVFQNNTGSYSIEMADGNGGVIYKPIEQWEPQNNGGQQQQFIPAGMPVVNAAPQMMQVGMGAPVAAQPVQVAPGGTVSINDWIRSNPVAAANYQTQQMQQNQLMMMQMYGGMMPGMMPGMAPGMMPGMMPGVVNNGAYIPTHMRAAAMMPTGMILPVGS